jgi:hypothetical protein
MSVRGDRQLPIGSTQIDGEAVEAVWAEGTNFITLQFADRAPRGIANLTGFDAHQPSVVPLSHRAWLAEGTREAELVEFGQSCFRKALKEHGAAGDRGSPAGPDDGHRVDDRNDSGDGLFNRHPALARTQ